MGIVLDKFLVVRSLVLLAVAVVSVTACGETAEPAASPESGAAPDDTLEVIAGFYPLEYVAARVGGRHVSVTNLTPIGSEPHHLELSPRDAAAVQEADLVVHLARFSPALDDALGEVRHALDVTHAAELDVHATEHDDDEHDDGEHDNEGADPHFWLDPTKLADVADAVADRLATLAPESADEFAANAAAVRSDLQALDDEFAAGLAQCDSHQLVTSHAAFGYLADQYGLEQIGITGLSPEAAPSPAKLAEVTEYVNAHGVTTIFYETLVDPAIAEAVADETGAVTAVLDPLEGLTDASSGADYVGVMRSNLVALRAGLGCR